MINYYLLTKPGIILGNLFTVAAGFLLAAKGSIHFPLFFATLIGLSTIIASACVFNNYIDRHLDKKMERTKSRPLVKGLIPLQKALLFATFLGIVGCSILIVYTNFLTVLIASLGFFVYVILYSMWKGKTIYGTAIGSIAGAVPPLVGYCAAGNHFDMGAIILFAIMIFWQMPHFFAIAMVHFKDSSAASIPALPIQKGIYRTKWHMVCYIIAFIISCASLTWFNYTGYLYLFGAMVLGLAWLSLCLKGFKSDNNQLWARKMFHFSLVMILGLCFMIPLDVMRTSNRSVEFVYVNLI
jgi:protoheme IX farnesyltransferase